MFVYMKVDNLKKFYLFKQADSNFNKINCSILVSGM